MARNILIGIGAGLAAALLFAALISGTTLAFPLFILSPLPIAIAGLGFGTASGSVAAAVASAMIALYIGNIVGGIYLILFAAPIAVAAHWIGLSRPVPNSPDRREWFPLSSVLARLAIVVAAAIVIVGILIQYDPTSLIDQTTTIMESWLTQDAAGAGGDIPSKAELEPLVRINFALMPFTTSSIALLILVFDTWLAARIVKMSSLLQREWTPLWSITLPLPIAAAFGVALVVSFVSGPVGLIAGAVAGSLGFAFALTGFGLLHAVLAGNGAKPFALIAVYVFSFVFVVPVALLAFAGVADTLFHLRARRLAGRAGNP